MNTSDLQNLTFTPNINKTKSQDSIDSKPSKILIVTNTKDKGKGSLREAIKTANNQEGRETIQFSESLAGKTITLRSGELDITTDLTIEGLGAKALTIDANNNPRVFSIDEKVGKEKSEVTIEGLTITGASGKGLFWYAGAIYNLGTLTISNTDISNNKTSGIYGGNLKMINSTITNNQSKRGGGIYNQGETILINTTISDNQSDESGGGIYNDGIITIINSTISQNSSGSGGGIFNRHELKLINSTISGNQAYTGGGILNYSEGASYGRISILNSTITANKASSGAGIFTRPVMEKGLKVGNSIISGNLGTDVLDAGNESDSSSWGNNLIGTTNYTQNFAKPGDLTGVTDPKLETLGNNGGLTLTHALKSDSKAKDAGNKELLPEDTEDLDGDGIVSEPLPIDQRGENRQAGNGLDIGAYELSATNNDLKGTTDNDQLLGTSLSERIQGLAGDDTINTYEGEDTLNGDLGNDLLEGGQDKDILTGSKGNDTLDGGLGRDILKGGVGNDVYFVDMETEKVIEEKNSPNDVDLIISKVNYSLGKNLENLRLEGQKTLKAVGNELDNILTGNGGKNKLYGRKGHDSLSGGDGLDLLSGGQGNDLLVGEQGKDTLIGGSGSDRFFFNLPKDGSDIIKDFQSKQDFVVLPAQGFQGGLVPGKLLESQFIIGSQASQDSQRIIYNPAEGNLFFDTDGSGVVEAIKIARLSKKPQLSINNFLIEAVEPTF